MDAFRVHYEMILEGEIVVDVARANLVQAEQKERKIKGNLKRISKVSALEIGGFATLDSYLEIVSISFPV